MYLLVNNEDQPLLPLGFWYPFTGSFHISLKCKKLLKGVKEPRRLLHRVFTVRVQSSIIFYSSMFKC